MSDLTKDELQKRMQELEEENKRLRNPSINNITVTEVDYKGHPTLRFEGKFMSFGLGIAKLARIKSVWPEIENFLEKHTEVASKYLVVDDDKI
ncbi:hypothetical protein [Desulfobacula sp.]|uniref:hypothetical protein n=1 Tax=Desulfobacula sp. TaxID=2593537 RepID=UPI001ED42D49|nr:hypothetical protein [Desulfobacula sp.]